MPKKKTSRSRGGDAKRIAKSLRRLERRVAELAAEHQALRKRVKRLRRASLHPPRPPGPPWPPGGKPGPKRGGPPWARGLGPVVSLEVPLETDDPTAPLWATVAARLPEEITTVDDEGRVVRYRYSAAGSTPQAPSYRRLAEPPAPPPPDPGEGPHTFRG